MRTKHPNAPFFPKANGDFYESQAIYSAFRVFLLDAGISHGGRGEGPRVHDLRHTFAVNCLRKWVLSGDDIAASIPYLSAYLGHVHFRHSQIYLHLTVDMHPDIVAKTEAYVFALARLLPRCQRHQNRKVDADAIRQGIDHGFFILVGSGTRQQRLYP